MQKLVETYGKKEKDMGEYQAKHKIRVESSASARKSDPSAAGPSNVGLLV
jgi:hypothetical protein